MHYFDFVFVFIAFFGNPTVIQIMIVSSFTMVHVIVGGIFHSYRLLFILKFISSTPFFFCIISVANICSTFTLIQPHSGDDWL